MRRVRILVTLLALCPPVGAAAGAEEIHAALADGLMAKYYLPMHAWSLMYDGLAHFRGSVKNARIMPATYPGDRFVYRDGQMTQFFAKRTTSE